MRITVVLLAACCWLSTVHGQALERTIRLPDSLGSGAFPRSILFCPEWNKVYVGDDSGSVLVVDGATYRRLGRIQAGQAVWYLSCAGDLGKVFATGSSTDPSLYVISCASDSVAAVPVGVGPLATCYDSASRKLYCANTGTNDVTVIDALTDSVITTIAVGEHPVAICLNPVSRKVYTANRGSDNVSVIDIDGDSVLATVAVGLHPQYGSIVYNLHNNQVYCGCVGVDTVYVIDGQGDSVIARVKVRTVTHDMAYNPVVNKVYVAGSRVSVIDCSTNTQTAVLDVAANNMACNPADGRVYWAGGQGDSLVAVSPLTDSVIGTVQTGYGPNSIALDAGHNRAFCASGAGLNVTVVDCSTLTRDTVVYAGFHPVQMCYSPAENKIYVVNDENFGMLSVIDATTYQVLANVRAGNLQWAVQYSALHDKVYGVEADNSPGQVVAFDGAGDSVYKTIPVGSAPDGADIAYSPRQDLVYCAPTNDSSIQVIDGVGDSVTGHIQLPDYCNALWYVGLKNKLYASCYPWNFSVVNCSLGIVTAFINVCPPYWRDQCCTRPAGDKVYFVSYGMLRIIDARADTLHTDTLIMRVHGGELCYNATDDKVYWPNWNESSVTVIDAEADSIMHDAAVGGMPWASCWVAATDHVYIGNRQDGTVSVLDGATDSVIRTIWTGDRPEELLSCESLGVVFVANYGGSSVSVIRDTTPVGVNEAAGIAARRLTSPTVVGTLDGLSSGRFVFYDATGRRVSVPASGKAPAVGPGIYFVVGPSQARTKIVVVR